MLFMAIVLKSGRLHTIISLTKNRSFPVSAPQHPTERKSDRNTTLGSNLLSRVPVVKAPGLSVGISLEPTKASSKSEIEETRDGNLADEICALSSALPQERSQPTRF